MSLTEAEVEQMRAALTGNRIVAHNAGAQHIADAIARAMDFRLNALCDLALAQIRAQGQKPVCELPDGVPLYAAPLVPQGMVLVPVEPTEEMLESALDAFRGFPVGRPSLVGCYKAMLSAAQGGKNG